MTQYISATLQSIETWFSSDWAVISAFFVGHPYLIVVACVAIIGSVVIGLREPKTAKN